MCCAEFIVKYVLIIVNLVISVLGLVIIGLGIAGLVVLSDVSGTLAVVNIIPISLLVLGSIVFLVAFLACCGAMRESPCMLVSYAIAVGILAALKMWLLVVIFTRSNDRQNNVNGWLESAFNDNNLRRDFQHLEHSFTCCGTTGVSSYTAISQPIPFTCCNTIWTDDPESYGLDVCTTDNSFGGCAVILDEIWVESSGSAVITILLIIIMVEITAIFLALFLCYSYRQKRSKTVY